MTNNPAVAPFATEESVRALRRSPLNTFMSRFESASTEDFAVREIPFLTMLALRALPETDGHTALADATGIGLPASVGQVVGDAQDTAILWISPDEFLLIAPDEPEAANELFGTLSQTMAPHRGDVVDVSSNRTTIEVSGPTAREVLKTFVPSDLHDRSFPVNHAITTTAARNPILLWRTGEDTWRLMPRASYAEYVALWILDASREFRH